MILDLTAEAQTPTGTEHEFETQSEAPLFAIPLRIYRAKRLTLQMSPTYLKQRTLGCIFIYVPRTEMSPQLDE